MVNHSFRTKPKSTKRRSPYWIAKRWMPIGSGLIPSILTTVHWLLFTVLWPRRESSRARPRPSLAFRRCALLLPSGWPRRESNPDLAFRKRLFYPLNYSANLYSLLYYLYSLLYYLYSIISTFTLEYTHHYAPLSDFPLTSSGKFAGVCLLSYP